MDFQQALDKFWNGFGVIAFQDDSVPDANQFEDMNINPYPRITYSVSTNDFGVPTSMTASIWDRSTSWKTALGILKEVKNTLKNGGVQIHYNEGVMWIKTGTPFSSEMSDPDDTIKRIVINIETEYLEV